MSQALQREKIAQKFHQVTEQIEAALSEIRYDNLDISEEVREQVLLQILFILKRITAYIKILTIDDFLLQKVTFSIRLWTRKFESK